MHYLTAVDPTSIRSDGRPSHVWVTTDEVADVLNPGAKSAVEKPFPNWLYLHATFYLLENHKSLGIEKGIFGIEKARQVLMTTGILAWANWYCSFRQFRKGILSKITQPEAEDLLEAKIRIPYRRQPPWIREALHQTDKPRRQITYKNSGSLMQAVAENAAAGAMRGISASLVVVDEAAKQKNLDAMMRAALPMAAMVVALTSADGGELGGQSFIHHFSLNDRKRMKPIKLDFKRLAQSLEHEILPEIADEWLNM